MLHLVLFEMCFTNKSSSASSLSVIEQLMKSKKQSSDSLNWLLFFCCLDYLLLDFFISTDPQC